MGVKEEKSALAGLAQSDQGEQQDECNPAQELTTGAAGMERWVLKPRAAAEERLLR